MKPFVEDQNQWPICLIREWPLAALLALPHIVLRVLGRQGFIRCFYNVELLGHQHTLMFSNEPIRVRLINAYYGWQFYSGHAALQRRTHVI